MTTIVFIIAMKDEFSPIESLFGAKKIIPSVYESYSYKYSDLEIIVNISGIGKAASSACTSYSINRHDPDLIINLGSSGGLNSCNVGDIILSKNAGYGDVDVTAFGYKKGQMAGQKELFTSEFKILSNNILTKLCENNAIKQGTIITCDSFINDKAKAKEIASLYENSIALEMESAALAQVCTLYNKEFLLIKKVSDLADENAQESFKGEIPKMAENLSSVIEGLLNSLSK